MKERLQRLKKIKDIISSGSIGSQEQLQSCLEERGITVTQATLSRDLKFLKVSKIPEGESGFVYRLPDAEAAKETEDEFLRDIERGIISVTYSGNLAVLATMPGHANSVAFALDHLELPEIIGTIAGDDTILLILHEKAERDTLNGRLLTWAPSLEIEK